MSKVSIGNVVGQVMRNVVNSTLSTYWKGLFTFQAVDDLSEALEVTHFSVTGGTDRKVELAASNDMAIVSEAEQARSYKNINLFLRRDVPRTGRLLEWTFNRHLTAKIEIFLNRMTGNVVQDSLILTSSKTRFKNVNRWIEDETSYYIRVACVLSKPRLIYSFTNTGGEQQTEEI